MKVGFYGDRDYCPTSKVKELIFLMKDKIKDLEIVGTGAEWMKKNDEVMSYKGRRLGDVVRKFSLDMGIKYSEFPPVHFPYNSHCVLEPFNYGRPYKPFNYNIRDKQMVEYCDKMYLIVDRIRNVKYMIKQLERFDKPYLVTK